MELVEKKDIEILETFFKEKEYGPKELQLAFPEWMQMKNLPQRSFSHAVYHLRSDNKFEFVKFPFENMESKWKKVKDYLFQYGYYSEYLDDTFGLLSEEDQEELKIGFILDFIELAGDDRRFSEIEKVNKEDIVQKIRTLFNYSDNELRLYYLYLQKYLEINFFKGECFYLIEQERYRKDDKNEFYIGFVVNDRGLPSSRNTVYYELKVSNESCFSQNLDAYKEEHTFLNYSNVAGGKDNFYRYVKNFNDWLQNHMYLEDRYHDYMIWYTNEKVYFNLEKGVLSKKLSSEFAKLNMFYPTDNLKDIIDVFVDYVSDVIGKCEWNKGKLNEVYKITIEESYKELKILAKEYRNEKKDWENYCKNLQVFFDNLPQKKDYEYYLIRNSFLYWKDLLVIGIKRNKPTDYDIFAYLLGDNN